MESNFLLCSKCGFDYTHLLTSLKFTDDDSYKLLKVSFDSQEIDISHKKIKYPYRSQGNIHLLFFCEDQHYFHKSFDGHKGCIHVDENPIMTLLCDYLNRRLKTKQFEGNDYSNTDLESEIKNFFISVL